MKIDIVDLMDFYWNDAPVPDAPEEMEELPKQRGTWVPRRETGRRRNRPLLAAAAMLLAVLVAVPFVLFRPVGDSAVANAEDAQSAEVSDDDRAAEPVGNPDVASKENVQSAQASGEDQTAHPVGILLHSAVYPVALEVPVEYAAEIEVDTPFQDNPYGTPEGEIQFDNVVFSFYDKFSQAYGRIGLVWSITATPKNEYTPPDPMYYDFIFEYNEAELGTDEDYVYTLIYPSVSRQCNPDDPENANSYFAHLAIGQDLLTQFIQQNSLQSDGAGLERYAAYLASFDYQTAYPDGNPATVSAENAQSAEASDDYQTAHIAGLLLPSAVYPVVLEIPAEYVEEIEVDTPFQDMPMPEYEILYDNAVFSFYDKSSQTYGLIGLVWCILATPKNEYTPLGPANYDYIYEYNRAELGADEDYVYELIYPIPSHQYNHNDSENADSYFAHHAIGQDLLTQFIQQNSLQSDGAGVERYATYLASFDYQTAYPDSDSAAASAQNAQSAEASDNYQTAHLAGTLLPSAVYPVALEVPAEYAAEIEVDTPFQDTWCFPFMTNPPRHMAGSVWCGASGQRQKMNIRHSTR